MPVLKLELAQDIPEGWTPVEVVSVIKCLDDSADTALCVRQSGGLSTWEALGMITAAEDMVREAMKGSWQEREEDD